MKGRTCLGITALAAAVSACTTTEEVPSAAKLLQEVTGQNGRACIQKDDIQGYGVLEDDIISIDATRGYYLATVLPGCQDLQTSIGIILTGDFNEVCGQSLDEVVTNEDYCTINQMYRFDSREEAFNTYQMIQERREEQE
jgi:hypothetical protein